MGKIFARKVIETSQPISLLGGHGLFPQWMSLQYQKIHLICGKTSMFCALG